MSRALYVPVLFASATIGLYLLTINAPKLKNLNGDSESFIFPTSFGEIKQLSTFFTRYNQQHSIYVTCIFTFAYLYKQSFAIPGSVMMNIIAGLLYGIYCGFFITCILTAIGSSICYTMSRFLLSDIINSWFSEKLVSIRQKVEKNKQSILFFLLFARLFPMSPNWFMNITFPHVNVPLTLFFTSVLIGLMPYNYICVQAGAMIGQYNSIDDIFTFVTLLKLFSMALAMLIPGILINRIFTKRNNGNTL